MSTFADIFAGLDDGQVHDEATHQLREVVRAARSAQKKGSLVIKIDVTPDGRQYILSTTITPKIPTPTPGVSMFFASDAGDLLKSDPAQLPLRHVERPAQPIRSVGIDANKGA